MRRMIFTGLLVFTLSVCVFSPASTCFAENEASFGPQIQIAIPGAGDYDLYESGVGVELQYRNWVDGFWGYLLAVGYSEWQADASAKNPGANLYDFDGNIDFVPLGASLILNAFTGEDVSITLEGGLRYLMIDSEITARNSDQSPANRYDVDVDDSVIARIAADLDYVLNEDFILSLGLAYHYDIDRGSLSTELGSGRENIMDAVLVQIALRMPL